MKYTHLRLKHFYTTDTKLFQVILNVESVKAMAYVMNEQYPVGIADKYYYNTILDGYKSFGLDTGVLEEAVRFSAGITETEDDV